MLTSCAHRPETNYDPLPATTSPPSEEEEASDTTSSSPYKSLQAFTARLTHANLATRPFDATIALSLALEHRPDPRSRAYQTRATALNFHVPIAAHWIMAAGLELYDQYIVEERVDAAAPPADYAAGPLWWRRKCGTWEERWAFWKEGFADVAEREEGCGEGVREVARAAARRMGEIERRERGGAA